MAESVTAEVKENPSLRARAKARVDKPEQPSAEKQKKSKNSENAATDDEQLGRLQPACLGIGVAVVLASIILYLATPPGPMKPRIWTPVELARYNGSNPKLPLLLSILGSVFDVSKGHVHYGPNGSYHHFLGRDASRAFVSGNFTGAGLTDSLKGLTASEIKSIEDWRFFFSKTYIYVGKLVGRFYDEDGNPTKELNRVAKKIAQANKLAEQQKADEDRFPNCNSRWSQDKGGEVWCNSGHYPRIVERVAELPRKGPPGTRCACFEEDELKRPGLRVYESCDYYSNKCNTS
ncbi:unnamed protein product [Sphagnum jensenii]|uniref:Cytochrome b5 heme-binding domain-containing protein n=1 Tax=Sphagnum jensenii TaxID=128206 RepID=A0ABP0X7T9_9BRYO